MSGDRVTTEEPSVELHHCNQFLTEPFQPGDRRDAGACPTQTGHSDVYLHALVMAEFFARTS